MTEAAETASAPILDINGPRATIRLNRPRHLNRLQADDLDVMLDLFDRIEADETVRVLVLDLVDFRLLMARHPDLASTIDAEARRRALENK